MKRFMDTDFLLDNETSKRLYFEIAEKLPIIDYHCHLSPREIAEDIGFSNITEIWLYGDHYKWRAMRECGIDEKYITGNASDYEKFAAYCRCIPMLAGNPLVHWSHLELKRYFDCDLFICPDNCEEIWRVTSERLSHGDMTARSLIERSNVRLLCTTDDPADTLEYHEKLANDGFSVKVLPSFRPDKILNIGRRGIRAYIEKLGHVSGIEIRDLSGLESALEVSLDRFEKLGCRTADHGIDNYVAFAKPDPYNADRIFKKALATDGASVNDDESALWKTQIMRILGKYYVKHGWVMQLHYGVIRNPNSKMLARLGADSGFDAIDGRPCIDALARLLDYLEVSDALPRTVIYPINSSDNSAVATLAGSFCRGDGSDIPTVVQGCAWWFNDNLAGIRSQLETFSSLSAIGKFPGMLTDSRSFLSYTRHEYFRRIFCNLLGELVEGGQYPDEPKYLDKIVRSVCLENTERLFGFRVSLR